MSTSQSIRRLCAFCLVILLAACAPRPTAERAAAVPDARIIPIFVATSRPLDQTGQIFGLDRSKGMNHFRVDVSIPPSHEPGKIEWPKENPDARTDFVVTGTELFASADQMKREIRASKPGLETLVYIHGYNNTLSESMYRLAQIQADFDAKEPSVLFSWPSAGDARGYIYDRDSILFARDDLERLLRQLTSRPGEKVFLFAHSMGAQLTMEVLRQIAVRGDRRLLERISGVVLMSPDIDPDLFQRQAEAIGTLPQPFLIFITKADRVLSLSGFITGRKPRLGVIDAADKVQRRDVQVIDFSDFSDGKGYNHMTPVTSPASIGLLNAMTMQSGKAGAGMLREMKLSMPPKGVLLP